MGQPLWAHMHASATSEKACVSGSLPFLPLQPLHFSLSECTHLNFRLQGYEWSPRFQDTPAPYIFLWNSPNGPCASPGHYTAPLGSSHLFTKWIFIEHLLCADLTEKVYILGSSIHHSTQTWTGFLSPSAHKLLTPANRQWPGSPTCHSRISTCPMSRWSSLRF